MAHLMCSHDWSIWDATSYSGTGKDNFFVTIITGSLDYVVVGCNGTNSNTGFTNGIISLLAKEIGNLL